MLDRRRTEQYPARPQQAHAAPSNRKKLPNSTLQKCAFYKNLSKNQIFREYSFLKCDENESGFAVANGKKRPVGKLRSIFFLHVKIRRIFSKTACSQATASFPSILRAITAFHILRPQFKPFQPYKGFFSHRTYLSPYRSISLETDAETRSADRSRSVVAILPYFGTAITDNAK